MKRNCPIKLIRICKVSMWVLIFGLATAVADEAQTPHQVIETTVHAVSERLDGRVAYYTENRDALYTLIDELLLPHFDVRYAGRLVLGNYWSTATEEQRERFIDVFYQFLMQSYANGILEFEQDSIVVLPPADDDLDPKKRVVMTAMRLDDGSSVPINYSMRNSREGWRVYDVRIEGVSYIHNYRNQFNAEIRAVGVDGVIDRLNGEVGSHTTE